MFPGFKSRFARSVWRREGRALHQFHHQVIRTNVIERADVGMIQHRHGVRLAFEPLAKLLRGYLDGDLAVETSVAGFPHLAHAPEPMGARIF